ncbi:swr complex subunit, partial [Elasticomyces elasticus]
MASTRDIHDIMGMGSEARKPAPKKKKKIAEAQPRLSGISREVQALMGDSVPPIVINEAPKYKSRPSLAQKLMRPRHWAEREFQHGARQDPLVLRHWKRAIPNVAPLHHQQTGEDSEMADTAAPESTMQFEEEFPMGKWNADDWTREETDYLMQLVADFDVRWIVIADRYDPSEISHASHDGNVPPTYPPRTTEQLKARYYQMAAKDLELRIPASHMTQAEFKHFETMKNFDAKNEGLRKNTAEKLFERTKEEAEEEKTLLEELHRITKNEDEFVAIRRDLYSRLEAAPSLRRNERGEEQNIVLSSAGLSELLNRLFAREKQIKRRLVQPGEQSATQQTPLENRGRPLGTTKRQDTAETAVENQKKGPAPPQAKQLKPEEEERFGISRPQEKLTSGVLFRHEKINRITTAKSQVQTQKILATLTELEIPSRLSMPTEKVCKEFERLVGQITLLLDAKKNMARVLEEVKILEEVKRQRLGLPAEPSPGTDNLAEPGPPQLQIQASTADETQMTDVNDGEPGPAVHDDDEDAE